MRFLRWCVRRLPALLLVVLPRASDSQVADHYRGTVVNDEVTAQPATLELFIYARTDSTTVGWMKVGRPLAGSGNTVVVAHDMDSLYFVTVTAERDTIVWASPQRTGTLEGRYWIKGPSFDGQGGKWRLVPQPRTPQAALFLFALCAGATCVVAIAAMTAARYRRWWTWRVARGASLSPADRERLSGISGWLAWFVLGQAFLLLYLLGTFSEVWDPLGGTWMLGAAVSGMRPTLLVESAGHFFQLLGISFGIFLIWRKSQLTPMYYTLLLIGMGLYAFFDIFGTSGIGPALTALFGPEATDEMTRSMREATTQNSRLVLNSAIWSLYWIRSRRVHAVFGPKPQAVEVPADVSIAPVTVTMTPAATDSTL